MDTRYLFHTQLLMAFQPPKKIGCRGRCGSCCSCSTRGWPEWGKGTQRYDSRGREESYRCMEVLVRWLMMIFHEQFGFCRLYVRFQSFTTETMGFGSSHLWLVIHSYTEAVEAHAVASLRLRCVSGGCHHGCEAPCIISRLACRAAFARRHQIQSALQQTKVEVDLQKGAQRWKEWTCPLGRVIR